jgi:GcrA cell cycle regulator
MSRLRKFESSTSSWSRWTDQRIERLKTLWVAGLSASQIAKDLGGVSRSAVIGKVHRLGLPGRERPSLPGQAAAKAAVAKARRPRLIIAGGGSVFERAVAPPPRVIVPEKAFDVLPNTTPRPWTERTARQCNWPVGDGLSCCEPVDAFGLCAAHRRLGRVKSSKPTELARSLRRYL